MLGTLQRMISKGHYYLHRVVVLLRTGFCMEFSEEGLEEASEIV